MAKSLRASSKLADRNRKRYTPTSDYAVTAAARLQQVASRLKKRVDAPKSDREDDDEEPASAPEAPMQEEGQERAKISTSGPRGSRNELWRKNHKRNGSKNGGRTKRRR